MRRSLRLFCIIPFFLLFALPPTVHASLKAPRRVSSSPHILKPGEEDAFLESQLKSSSSVTPSSTPTSGDDDRHHHQQHKHRTHEHAHRIVKKEHHKRAASHEWTDSSKEVDTKTLTATVKSSEERPHVGVYGATSSIKTASSSSSLIIIIIIIITVVVVVVVVVVPGFVPRNFSLACAKLSASVLRRM